MAYSFFLVLLLGLFSPPAAAEQALVATDTLQAGRTLFNKDREYRFIMQWNCDLVFYEVSTTVWATNTVGHGSTCRAKLTNSGSLEVARGDGEVVWASPAPAATPYHVVALTSDRNVVIYSWIAWSTETHIAGAGHRAGDQILLQDNTLRGGEYLANGDLNYQLLMQEDCDLVLYDAGRRIWNSGTAGLGTGCTARLNPDGQLVVLDSNGKFVAGSVNHPPYDGGYAFLLLPDRRAAVAYAPVWETGTGMPHLARGLSSNSSSYSSWPSESSVAAATTGGQEVINGRMKDAADNILIQMATAEDGRC